MPDGPREIGLDQLDFAEIVRPGDQVMWTQGAGEPIEIVTALLEQRHSIGRFSVLLGASYVDLVRPEHSDVISFRSLGAVGTTRKLVAAGVADILPCHLSEVAMLFETGRLRADVVIVQLAEHPRTGELSFSSVNGYVSSAIKHARVVITEVNDKAPFTTSRFACERDDIDIVIRTSRDLVETPRRAPSTSDTQVADHVLEMIPDGATVQLGIGGIPQAVTEGLAARRDLSIHTGVIGDNVVDLIESGAVTNATKPFDQGITVTGGLIGTKRLFDFAHDNPALAVEPVSYTHSQRVLTQLPQLVAINSALEVDLSGQVGSEVAGSTYVGTIGGQLDFVRGGLASPGGRSIIALGSRTSSGRSRIVANLSSGVVTVPRADADVVITEWGIAELRGRSLSERVRALIAVAAPESRDDLERQAASAISGKASWSTSQHMVTSS
jgi:acyl-CoA hydrolase